VFLLFTLLAGLITISVEDAEQESAASSFLGNKGIGPPRYRRHAENDQGFIDSINKK
jgi:hypothetical protein